MRMPGIGSVVTALIVVFALSACSPQGAASPATASAGPSATTTATASSTPTPTPTPTNGPADAHGFAVQACESVSGGFAAASVAAAAASAARAAAMDPQFATLADKLTFIRDNPIDPATGEGPQQTIDDASSVAQECLALGVQVSQD